MQYSVKGNVIMIASPNRSWEPDTMTSLAHQLKRLALPQNDPNLLTRREVASLLFDPKDASSMDRSTFFALGTFDIGLPDVSLDFTVAACWLLNDYCLNFSATSPDYLFSLAF